ncbi:MAG: TadE/TadG family type IV pilus assembly protein [Candidatus Sulfotelmatobacter sp.]
MLNSAQSILRRLAAETRGAEIAEAAAVLPLMFMILLGIFWFGQAFSIYGAITRAAQEGARAGAAPYCATCTSANPLATNAVNAVTTAMVASKLDPTLTRFPVPAPVFTPCGTSWASASTKIDVQAPVLLKNSGSANGVCGVSVSFQYPFQFWLPFASLNKQKIWITASARVRMETQ